MSLCIGAINVYPVKSCRGVALQSAMLTEAGLIFDREWMVSFYFRSFHGMLSLPAFRASLYSAKKASQGGNDAA
jgi:hypothetical protein